jgi:hypothetical protein
VGFSVGVIAVTGVNERGERTNFQGRSLPATQPIKLPRPEDGSLAALPL